MTTIPEGTRRLLEKVGGLRDQLRRVVIGHSGDTTDLDYLEKLIAAGSYVGMDRFGIDSLLPTDRRVATIVKLCERGHAGSIVLAHDASCYIDWFEQAMLQAAMPRWHYLHIPDDVVPALRAAGVSEEHVRQMTTGNPRRIFEAQGAY